jgi:hypothetical protein
MMAATPTTLVSRTPGPDQLLTAARERRWLDGRNGSGRTLLDAEDIRRACLSASSSTDPFGIRIANAAISGALDLRAATVEVPLHFAACTFTSPPRFDGAVLHELAITDGRHGDALADGLLDSSSLPGLLANGVRIQRDLVLSGSVITGAHASSASLTRTSAVWLTEARIGGRLLAVGTKIYASGDRALQADRTHVAGDVRLVRGFLATGEVRLLAMQLGGSLDLTASQLLPKDGRALDIAEAAIGGSVFVLDDPDLRLRPRVEGRVEMGRTVVQGRLLIRNADLQAPPKGTALHDYNSEDRGVQAWLIAPRLVVHGQTSIEADTVIRGGLLLHGAHLAGGLEMDGAVVWNPNDLALDLSQSTIGAPLRARRALVEGTVNIGSARIAGPLDLHGAQFTKPQTRRSLIAVGAQIQGDVVLRRLTALNGSLNFRGASIAGIVDAEEATLINPGRKTLSLHQTHVLGNVRLCAGFLSIGLVVINRAVVEGRLRCDRGTFQWTSAEAEPGERLEPNPRGSAIEAISAKIRSGIGLGWRIQAGAVDFTDAQTTYLADDPDTDWPARSYLSGFAYERFAPLQMNRGFGEWDGRIRARWLARLEPYDPRPWEQVARVLRANGDSRAAEEVLIAQRRRARRHRREGGESPWRLLYDYLQDVTVRYGFRPQRALALLLVLIAAVAVSLTPTSSRHALVATDPTGTTYFATGKQRSVNTTAPLRQPSGDAAFGDGAVRSFDPLLYAIDVVVPIIDLHQRDTWYTDASTRGNLLQGWLNVCTLLGWTLSTIFALSLARIGRSSP